LRKAWCIVSLNSTSRLFKGQAMMIKNHVIYSNCSQSVIISQHSDLKCTISLTKFRTNWIRHHLLQPIQASIISH
jgi:hypothetical protein